MCGDRVDAPPPLIPAHSASLRAFTPVFDGLWTRVNALMLGIQSQAFELRDSGSPLSRGRTDGARRRAALILPAGVSSCAAVLPRGSIPSCLRARVPPEARSAPFPARPAGGAAIW